MIANIPEWPGYAVTDDGHVISFWQRDARQRCSGARSIVGDDGRIMPTFDRRDRKGKPTGYRSVCLSRAGKRKNFYVHELVLSVFVGPRPSTIHEVLHGNAERDDNRLSNLRWGTPLENAEDRERHGHVHRGPAWYRARGLPPPDLDGPSSYVRDVAAICEAEDHAFADMVG